jgi:uncharacterized protein YccT (UPF0319 family)
MKMPAARQTRAGARPRLPPLPRCLFLGLLGVALALAGCSPTAPAPDRPPAPVVPTQAPAPPVNPEATAVSADEVEIRWLDDSDDEVGFRVYRGTVLVGTVGANAGLFVDRGLQRGTTYDYAVKAYNQVGESRAALCSATTMAPPVAPSYLVAADTAQQWIQLRWLDNSDNENGFRVYRDGALIASVAVDVATYHDEGLQPATSYVYNVVAYNQIGASEPISGTIKTLNPALSITLDRIGVFENREPFPRGEGEVYVLIAVTDGESSVDMKLPLVEGEYFLLDNGQSMDVGATVFSTDAVGDDLTVIFIGYEADGGEFERLATEALGIALNMYTRGGAEAMADLFGTSLGSVIGTITGTADDFLGQLEVEHGADDDWGVGSYYDVVLQDEAGHDCLRLWYTIESPE